MYQIPISATNIKRMIGFSNVQELVQFFKFYFLSKSQARENRKGYSDSNFVIEILFWSNTNYDVQKAKYFYIRIVEISK